MCRLVFFFLMLLFCMNQKSLHAQRVYKAISTPSNFTWYLVLSSDSTYCLYSVDSSINRFGTGKYRESESTIVLGGSWNLYPDSIKSYGSSDSLYIQVRVILSSRYHFIREGILDSINFVANKNGWIRIKRPSQKREYLKFESDNTFIPHFLFFNSAIGYNTFYYTINRDKQMGLTKPFLDVFNILRKERFDCESHLIFEPEGDEMEELYYRYDWASGPLIFKPLRNHEIYPTINFNSEK
jgi:hypothetical protein